MDLTPTPTPTPTKSADSENDTPPHVQPINSLPFTNGTLKNYHHHQQQPPPPPPSTTVVTYRECLKNHAASIGRHAVDGCGEFMASSTATATATDPSMKCAACGCHRSFHRRNPDECYSSPTPISTNTPTTHFLDFQHHPLPQSRRFSPSTSPPPPHPLHPHMLLALSTAKEDHHRLPSPVTQTAGKGENSRKRFRTRFTQNQKEKMLCFAEKLNWKMPKSDESAMVEEFCNELGVSRGVLKVWIHNNKHTVGKKDSNNNNLSINNGNGIMNFQNNGYSNDADKNGQNSSNGGAHLHVSANGSSPSSS